MQITAQAVDITHGRPAAGVRVRLRQKTSDLGRELDEWITVEHSETDHQGYVRTTTGTRFGRGPYQLVLDTKAYFATLGLRTAYKEVSVVVPLIGDADACQIQVRLAPHYYSMYFGHRSERFSS